MKSSRSTVSAAVALTIAGLVFAGCAGKETPKAEESGVPSAQITVDATDSACTLSATQTTTGKRTFVVTNNGGKVTEFYVYGTDDKVLAEVENISPGLQRTLDVDFTTPGKYRAACKPGMVGDGISAELTVTG